MRYYFSKKQIIKNSLLAFVYTFIVSLFLIAVLSNLYSNILLELLAVFSVSLAVAIVFALINYIFYKRKTFSVDESGIVFYNKDNVIKKIDFSSVLETNIARGIIFAKNRVITLKTQEEAITFTVNGSVYQHIRGFFNIFNDEKESGLINFTPKYKLKTLLMQYCVIFFYSAVLLLIVTPIISALLKAYSKFYADAIRLYIGLCVFVILSILIGYTIYFFYKFIAYAKHSLRFDGTLKLEYFRFGKQKHNYEIKNIIGLKKVKSIFSFLFNLEQVYIIWKNDRDIIQNDFIPFCLSKQDVQKLESVLFNEQIKSEKIKKKTYFYEIFPVTISTFVTVGLSLIFTPWFLLLLLIIASLGLANLLNRSSYVGEKVVALTNGLITNRTYIFKVEQIKGVTITDRFFETKCPYACYEILLDGYSGVYAMGVYERDLEQKIIKKLKDC